MKILHIISSGGMYGAEAVILNMSRALNKGPHRSMLGVFSNSSQPNLQLHQAAAREGIESHLISCDGQMDRSVPASLRTLVKQTGADVVHAHGYKADVYLSFLLRRLRTPVVSTCHTWYDNDIFVRLYGALDRLALRRFAGVVAVSSEVERRLLHAGVPRHRVRLIRNGIDLDPFDRRRHPTSGERDASSGLTVGLVGRLSREKGIDLFLRAAASVLVQMPSTRFVVVGDGPDRAALEQLIGELGIGHRASLLGRREDMPSVYASLDVMVSASRQEGLPVALLEGMASGLPLVATAVGAVPSVIREGQTGILIPPENAELLASSILELLRDAPMRQRFGAAARTLIEDEFSADRMTSEYLHLYEEVVAEASRKLIPKAPVPARID